MSNTPNHSRMLNSDQFNQQEAGWWSQMLHDLDERTRRIEHKVYDGYSEALERVSQSQADLSSTVKEISAIVKNHDLRIQATETAHKNDEKAEIRAWKRRTLAVSMVSVVLIAAGIVLRVV